MPRIAWKHRTGPGPTPEGEREGLGRLPSTRATINSDQRRKLRRYIVDVSWPPPASCQQGHNSRKAGSAYYVDLRGRDYI
jgi:hypothetical protein